MAGGEQGDKDVEQHWQAKSKQGQADKADADPQSVDGELIGQSSANARNHGLITIFAKGLGHKSAFGQWDERAAAALKIDRYELNDQLANWCPIDTSNRQKHHQRGCRGESRDGQALDGIEVKIGHGHCPCFPANAFCCGG